MPYIIQTKDKPHQIELRRKLETEHRAYLDANQQIILAAGALLADDGNDTGGGVYIINVDSRESAEHFIAKDPFNQADLFEKIEIARWRKAYFNFANTLGEIQ